MKGILQDATSYTLFFFRIHVMSKNGKVITSQLIKGVLLEEGEIIQVNESHRRVLDVNPETGESALSIGFVENFCRRHKLTKTKIKEQPFQCNICYTNFAWEKTMIAHKKSVHKDIYNALNQV